VLSVPSGIGMMAPRARARARYDWTWHCQVRLRQPRSR
jgi:hypothetical protein